MNKHDFVKLYDTEEYGQVVAILGSDAESGDPAITFSINLEYLGLEGGVGSLSMTFSDKVTAKHTLETLTEDQVQVAASAITEVFMREFGQDE